LKKKSVNGLAFPKPLTTNTKRNTQLFDKLLNTDVQYQTYFYKEKEEVYASDGTLLKTIIRKKHHAPSEAAQKFWLKSRLPDKWKETSEQTQHVPIINIITNIPRPQPSQKAEQIKAEVINIQKKIYKAKRLTRRKVKANITSEAKQEIIEENKNKLNMANGLMGCGEEGGKFAHFSTSTEAPKPNNDKGFGDFARAENKKNFKGIGCENNGMDMSDTPAEDDNYLSENKNKLSGKDKDKE